MANFGVFEEPAHANLQKGAGWYVIRIEDSDVLARGLGQGKVEVAPPWRDCYPAE